MADRAELIERANGAVVSGTVVAVDFSSDDETLVTISVPTDSAWGYEIVSIVKHGLPARSLEAKEGER